MAAIHFLVTARLSIDGACCSAHAFRYLSLVVIFQHHFNVFGRHGGNKMITDFYKAVQFYEVKNQQT